MGSILSYRSSTTTTTTTINMSQPIQVSFQYEETPQHEETSQSCTKYVILGFGRVNLRVPANESLWTDLADGLIHPSNIARILETWSQFRTEAGRVRFEANGNLIHYRDEVPEFYSGTLAVELLTSLAKYVTDPDYVLTLEEKEGQWYWNCNSHMVVAPIPLPWVAGKNAGECYTHFANLFRDGVKVLEYGPLTLSVSSLMYAFYWLCHSQDLEEEESYATGTIGADIWEEEVQVLYLPGMSMLLTEESRNFLLSDAHGTYRPGPHRFGEVTLQRKVIRGSGGQCFALTSGALRICFTVCVEQ